MSESCKLARECKRILEENSESRQKRTREEIARIRDEEKLERLEMVSKNHKKLQKGYLTKTETRDKKGRTDTLLEVTGIEENWYQQQQGKSKP